MGLIRLLRGDLPPEERRRRFVGVAGLVLALFAVGFIIAGVRVWTALRSGKAWVNFRGDVITLGEMRTDLMFLLGGAVLSAALSWVWLRHWRRRP